MKEKESGMNEMKIFTNEEFGEVRMVEVDGKPYFCGADVAKALGYARPNDAVNAHCMATVKHSTPISGKMQEINFISEGDLYRLIVRSKLPSAEKFERWVFDEVLPSIRRHGMYTMDELIENPDLAINALTALKEERAKRKALELENQVKDQQIAELKPKASYYDLVLKVKDPLPITAIAEHYGMSARAMNEKLYKLGVQFCRSGVWFLYAEYQGKGYTQIKTYTYEKEDGSQRTGVHTYWSQKGRLFLYELLKQNRILPLIEREYVA